jgi:hypothetical protein
MYLEESDDDAGDDEKKNGGLLWNPAQETHQCKAERRQRTYLRRTERREAESSKVKSVWIIIASGQGTGFTCSTRSKNYPWRQLDIFGDACWSVRVPGQAQ